MPKKPPKDPNTDGPPEDNPDDGVDPATVIPPDFDPVQEEIDHRNPDLPPPALVRGSGIVVPPLPVIIQAQRKAIKDRNKP